MEPSDSRAGRIADAAPAEGAATATGIEVLLVRRSPEASFMPGVWVFPGGVVDRATRRDAER